MSIAEINDVVEPYICDQLSLEEIRNSPCWQAALSDGTSVYSKPHRRSWLELKSHLALPENKHLYIVGLYFRFRDHVECVHTGVADYFFANQASAFTGMPTNKFYLGGYRIDNQVLVRKYIVPEIYPATPFEELRSLDDITVKKGLIVTNRINGLRELNV